MTLVPRFTALTDARLYVTVSTVNIRARYGTGRTIKSRYWAPYIKCSKIIASL